MNWNIICNAFGSSLAQNGLALQERSHGGGHRSTLVFQAQNASWVALLEDGEPEYIGVTLNNGARFWEHEWSDEYQEVHAKLYGEVVVEHFLGRGELRKGVFGGRHYSVVVDGERINSKDFVSEAELSAIGNGLQ